MSKYDGWMEERDQRVEAAKKEAGSPEDEAQASIRAARFALDLSIKDRYYLIRDALDRIHNAGLKLNQIRDQLDINEM